MERITRLDTFARAGYAARGLVYLLLGYFALTTGGAVAASGVIGRLRDLPAGSFVLIALALGLAGYGVFRLFSAWQDLDGDGSDAKGLAGRTGRAASGIGHLVLAVVAVRLGLGSGGGDSAGGESAAETAFAWPGGAALVGVVGALIILAGLGNFLEGWAAKFRKVLDPKAPNWTHWAGRAGYTARGIVFVMVGWQVLALATGFDDGRIGMEAAMRDLSRRNWLFTAVALGFALFGLFSLIMARFARIQNENVLERLKEGVTRL